MTKKKRSRTGNNRPDHEVYRYGPIVLERIGRQIIMRNEMDAVQHAQFLERTKEMRPQIHDDIDKKIARLQEIFDTYSPVEVLSSLAASYILLVNDKEEVRCHFAEFIVSMVAADSNVSSPKRAPGEVIDEARQLVEDIYSNVEFYFSSEVAEHGKATVADGVRHSALLSWLYSRGDGYPSHYVQLIRDEFSPHEKVLQNGFGVSTEDIIRLSESVEKQIEGAAAQIVDTMLSVKESQKLFGEFADKYNFTTFEELRDKFNELPAVVEVRKKLSNMPDTVFEIDLSGVPERVVKQLTLQPGDNAPFRFERSDFWPTNSSLIYEKPFLQIDGKIYCFLPQTFSMNLRKILQALIKAADSKYFTKQYRDTRGVLLEEKSIDLLAAELPGAQIYRNVYYHIVENGEKKRPETDGIILFDRYIIIIEAKGSELTESGRRGGLKRLREDLGDIATKGQSQHSRTLEYIKKYDKPVFENKNGSTAFELDKTEFPHIIPIVTSLENLNFLMSSMKDMVELGIVASEPMPWFVSLLDLRVITELVDSPAQLLQYIQRRLNTYDKDFYRSLDELDSFGHYLKEGLYFEGADTGTTKLNMMFNGYSEPIDKYYEESGPKPHLNIPAGSRELVASIEASGLDGRTDMSIAILEGDNESQEAIANGVKQALNATRTDGLDHSATIVPVCDDNTGLTVATYQGDGVELDRVHRKYVGYAHLKKYQLRKNRWLLIFINESRPEKVELIDTIEGEWVYSADLEGRVKQFALQKTSEALAERRKIGRNEPCPCNSGKKYKKCCLGQI